MKTSFYFVLWILIYPILGLFNNSFIDNNAFIVALAIVWGLSWLLSRIMPDTLTYERASQIAPILEDVYTGNVSAFMKRLSRESNIEIVTAIYFIVTTIVIALAIFKAGVNDWIALAIFGFFTYGAITRSVSLCRAKAGLKSNPTPEKCMEIADDTYKLDYASYYNAHNGVAYADMLPPKPRYYKVYQLVSATIAVTASILGLALIVTGPAMMIIYYGIAEADALGLMHLLYGSLVAYFGVRDFISCIHTKSNTKSISKEQIL